MSVEDVFNPANRTETDPRLQKEKASEAAVDATYWEGKAKAAAAKREYEEEQRRARQADAAEGTAPEAPFTVKGSVNLGDFNLQEQSKQLQTNIDKIQADARTQIDALNQKSENYRDELHKAQITMVENSMKAQIDYLARMIEQGQNHKTPGLMDQIDQISKIAGALGYAKPEAGGEMPASLRLQILKMEVDAKQADRQFEWDKMESERTWQLTLKKMEHESALRAAEIANEEKKRNMFISPFESIGSAIARGLLDNGGRMAQGAPQIAAQPAQPTGPTAKRKKSLHRLQANTGDAGEIDCPECGEKVAIAPTARTAVCASCEAQFSIDRIPLPGEEGKQNAG